MFETVTIKKTLNPNFNLSLGSIAESLLFYQNVNIVLDHIDYIHLLERIGLDDFRALVSLPWVKIYVLVEGISTTTKSIGKTKVHQFALTHFGPRTSRRPNPRFFLKSIMRAKSDNTRRSNKIINKIMERIRILEFAKHAGKQNEKNLLSHAANDLSDSTYVQDLAFMALNEIVPEYNINPLSYFKCHIDGYEFMVDTDLDFERINSIYIGSSKKIVGSYDYVPKYDEIKKAKGKSGATTEIFADAEIQGDDFLVSPMTLVGSVISTRLNLMIAFNNMSEFMTKPTDSKMMQRKIHQILSRRMRSQQDIDAFKDIVFQNGRQIEDIVNSGEKSFGEFLLLLEKSYKFKEWVQDLHPEDKLVSEYVKSINKIDWLDRLPKKTIRFAFFTGAGLLVDAIIPTGVGTATGVAVGAGDTFVLDKMLKGWKPNQFVDGAMSDFVNDDRT